jgi:hypothetical protein
MAEKKVSYRDLYPGFADCVENPETTDTPVIWKNLA